MLSIFTKDLADRCDILSAADKGGEDHINIVLDTKSEIGLILLRQGWEIDIGVREIDTLLGRNLAIVAGTDTNGLLVGNGNNIKGKNSIINVDDTSRLNDLGDVLIVYVPGFPNQFETLKKKNPLTCSCHHKQ
jgi:hypothetical protein